MSDRFRIPRTVHLQDWSQKRERSRHAIWCVAYRILAKSESKEAAIARVSETLGISLNTLRKFCKNTIRIEFHD